jgi:hypothetical protein
MYTATYDATGKEIESNGNSGTSTSGPAGTASDNNYGSFETIVPSLQGNPVFTVSGWFKQNTVANLQLPWLIGKASRGGQPSAAMSWFGISSAGQPRVAIGGGGNLNLYYTTGSIQAGRWHHMVITVQPSGASTVAGDVKFYLDGVSQSTSSTSGTSGNINLGDGASPRMHWFWQENSTVYYDGSASNIKLYDTALTAEEVKTLYDIGRCDEGGHVVNFSKTRVGIGLGDGEAPRAALDVRGDIYGGCPVLFSCTASSATGVGAAMNWDRVHINKGGGISGTTFTAPVEGYYNMNVQAYNSSGGYNTAALRWMLNGVDDGVSVFNQSDGNMYARSEGLKHLSGGLIVYMRPGDYIQVKNSSQSGVNIAGSHNRFNGFYLSS